MEMNRSDFFKTAGVVAAGAALSGASIASANEASEKSLEQRVQELEDMRAIERLQARYWDLMDAKEWDEFRDCFTDDFEFVNLDNGDHMQGGDDMVEVIKGIFPDGVTSSHHGHQHYITIPGTDTAIAHWALQDDLYDAVNGGEFVGRAHYDNEYVRIDGQWRCSKMVLKYLRGEGQLKKCLDGCVNAYNIFKM